MRYLSEEAFGLRDTVLREDFSSFIERVFYTVNPGGEFLPNWHIDLLAEYLEACRNGEINRLVINMPPRMLKSLSVTVAWPAWLLGKEPSTRIMAASYAQMLSLKHAQDCRLVLQSPWYRALFPQTEIASGENMKQKIVTTQRGSRLATSVGGMAIGEGGNTLIVDDPLSPAQAFSATYRASVQRWFEHSFATRLDDKKRGRIVLVMQRLHEADLSGYLLGKGSWEHLCLPALSSGKGMSYGHVAAEWPEGEPLHPEREDVTMLARLKAELGSFAFSAQYLQQPMPEAGAMLKPEWIKRYHALPLEARVVQSWDTAIKAGTANDYSVCITAMVAENRICIADVWRQRAEYPELKRSIPALAEKWQPEAVLIEDKASGQMLLQDLRRETTLPVLGIMPDKNKIARFAASTPTIEAGNLFFPERSPWLSDFETELIAFPHVAHDDQVDALSQLLNWLRNGRGRKPVLRRL